MEYRQPAREPLVPKTTCAQCHVSQFCLPQGIPLKDFSELEKLTRPSRPLHRDETIFRADTPFRLLYVVRSGAVKLFYDSPDGQQKILGFYFPGDLLGLDAIYSGRYKCSASALETTTVCTLNYQEIQQAIRQIEGFDSRFFNLMSREINQENDVLLLLKSKTAEQRLAIFLLSLAGRYQTLGYSEKEFKLPMSRAEIGSYLGLTIETMSRLFSRMQRAGLVENKDHMISIKNREALQLLADNRNFSH